MRYSGDSYFLKYFLLEKILKNIFYILKFIFNISIYQIK